VSAVEQIAEPGVYEMPSEVYHAHPALSSSGARLLLPPNCPALYRWRRDHPPESTRTFDFGHAAHKMVLGEGMEIVAIDAPDYRTKAAQAERDAVRDAGKVPLLDHEVKTVLGMADALRAHPVAAALIEWPGKPERSLFRQDKATGVWLRSRIDWLPQPTAGGRMTIPDYKTTVSAEPLAFGRSVARYGYFQQAAWYVDMVLALGLAEDVHFVFLAQEKTAPYLVTVFELDEYSLELGRKRNRKAIDLFARCVERDEWPTYAAGVETLTVPVWADDDEEIVIS
jgi:hypothetical protein